jgi:hypothetical protein
MKLVDEIIEMASDSKEPLANVLRKCLVLAFELKNEKLKGWVEKELNGFDRDDVVPEYRKAMLHSKGNFSGPFGAWIPKRPLPWGVLEKQHQELLVSKFTEPIGAYDMLASAGKKGQAVINWAPDLIAHYQAKFIEGYALSQAWQEVPTSLIIGLCEQVRNRVLRFVLEIKEELGHVEDKASAVPAEKVEAAVINYIYGGTNVIGGMVKDFSQFNNIIIAKGDFNGLKSALKGLEVPDAEIALLKQAIDADGADAKEGLGQRTKHWLRDIGSKLGKAGLKVGTTVAQEVAKEWLMQYYGLK